MGIKSTEPLAASGAQSKNSIDEIQQMQKKAFEHMDKEYEYARVTTHLNRGKGQIFFFDQSSDVKQNFCNQILKQTNYQIKWLMFFQDLFLFIIMRKKVQIGKKFFILKYINNTTKKDN